MVRAKLLQGTAAEAVIRFEGVPASDREFAELDFRLQSGFDVFVVECRGRVRV